MQEEQLIEQFKNGKIDALDEILSTYKTMVTGIARRFYLIGGDQDDLIQEGMIGLYKACRDYSPDKKISFKTFAYVCVQRQIQSAIRNDNRQKNLALNSALYYDSQNGTISVKSDDFEEENFMYLPSISDSPESKMIEIETYNEKVKAIKETLSNYEFDVLKYYLQGYKINQIATKLSKDAKSVDNALVRLKQKLDFLKKS